MREKTNLPFYLTCIRNFVSVLHKYLLSNNLSNKESLWVLAHNILEIK